MNITFIQTADPIFYYPMLYQTSRTVRQYCIQNGLRYESYVGVKRGHMPWQATYNRVYMLKELVDRGVTGWVYYLDADALIHDMDFDVREYLDDKRHLAGIFAGYCGSDLPYAINAGGFAINLSHVTGRRLAVDYHRSVEEIPARDFDGAIRWGRDVPEDQLLLHTLLRDYVEYKGLGEDFLFERIDQGYTNNGPFIRQKLRSHAPDFRTRTEEVRREVDAIMAGRRDGRGDDGSGFYLRADHPRLLTSQSRKRDGEIRSIGEAGVIAYGPYMPLKAGSYVARVFGRVLMEPGDSPVRLGADVTSGWGEERWTQATASFSSAVKGLLLQQQFTISKDVEATELRVFVQDPDAKVAVHAVQILWTDPGVTE